MLEPHTIDRILSDTKFDPMEGDLLGQALVAFIGSNANEVSKNKVAIKWLKRDRNVAHDFVHLVDTTDPDDVGAFLLTMKGAAPPNNSNGLKRLFGHMSPSEEVFQVILNHVDKNYHMDWFGDLSGAQRTRLVKLIREKGLVPWGHEDWRSAIGVVEGISWFVEQIPLKPNYLFQWTDAEFLQLVSEAAMSLKRAQSHIDLDTYTSLKRTILKLCDEAWPERYVCYHCGRGNGVYIMKRGKQVRNYTNDKRNMIFSMSGYTLHRSGSAKSEGCDPAGKHPSPHEILTGRPRQFSYPCEVCGEPFSTKSGKTLHERNCFRGRIDEHRILGRGGDWVRL